MGVSGRSSRAARRLIFQRRRRMPAAQAPMSDPTPLLDTRDPPPFRVAEGAASSPFFIAADHAGRVIPRGLGSLGLSSAELDTHIAWDIGIGGVSQHLAAHLEAFFIAQIYSRLVIDCNRPLSASSSIVQQSEYTVVPGNAHVSAADAEARALAIFHPYHDRIEAELDRRESAGQKTIFIAMHSFTPRYKGFDRPWHVGVLYNREKRLALPLLDLLRREGARGRRQPTVLRQRRYRLRHSSLRRGPRQPVHRARAPAGSDHERGSAGPLGGPARARAARRRGGVRQRTRSRMTGAPTRVGRGQLGRTWVDRSLGQSGAEAAGAHRDRKTSIASNTR